MGPIWTVQNCPLLNLNWLNSKHEWPSGDCFPDCFLKCGIWIFPRPLHCHNLHFIKIIINYYLTHFFISSVGLMKEKWIPFSQLGIVFVLFVLQSFISLIINIKRSTWNRHFSKKKSNIFSHFYRKTAKLEKIFV